MRTFLISVIIPVYNQFEQLTITLDFFNIQSFDCDLFEVIVVNDASTDKRPSDYSQLSMKYKYSLRIVNSSHSGSGVSRNIGVMLARSPIVVFCDADRFPEYDYLKIMYQQLCKTKDTILLGCVKECYAIEISAQRKNTIEELSRLNKYYNCISCLFDADGKTQSPLSWIAFLVGNSCMRKETFDRIGGFDPQFDRWGFEHFDFAIRAVQQKIEFRRVVNCINYHIPHGKSKKQYLELFNYSAKIIDAKYKNNWGTYIKSFLSGQMSLQEFEVLLGDRSLLETEKKPIYYSL